jgi:hypothetical protein
MACKGVWTSPPSMRIRGYRRGCRERRGQPGTRARRASNFVSARRVAHPAQCSPPPSTLTHACSPPCSSLHAPLPAPAPRRPRHSPGAVVTRLPPHLPARPRNLRTRRRPLLARLAPRTPSTRPLRALPPLLPRSAMWNPRQPRASRTIRPRPHA